MIKDDEKRLMNALRKRASDTDQVYVRELVEELGIPEKRAVFLVLKWSKRGWYEYGVNCLAGWLTPEGHSVDLATFDS